MLDLITTGVNVPDVALTLNRVALGVFFSISGYHKLFNRARHATLVNTLVDDGVRAIPVMQWAVPTVEFCAGLALVVGLLSALSALGLIVICLGACAVDGRKRVAAWSPIDSADRLDDWLYLPEFLYTIGLAIIILAGPGAYSIDRLAQ